MRMEGAETGHAHSRCTMKVAVIAAKVDGLCGGGGGVVWAQAGLELPFLARCRTGSGLLEAALCQAVSLLGELGPEGESGQAACWASLVPAP